MLLHALSVSLLASLASCFLLPSPSTRPSLRAVSTSLRSRSPLSRLHQTTAEAPPPQPTKYVSRRQRRKMATPPSDVETTAAEKKDEQQHQGGEEAAAAAVRQEEASLLLSGPVIKVEYVDEWNGGWMSDVVIDYGGGKTTKHTVTVGFFLYNDVVTKANREVDPETLVKYIFKFMLDRKMSMDNTEGMIDSSVFPVNYFSAAQVEYVHEDFRDRLADMVENQLQI